MGRAALELKEKELQLKELELAQEKRAQLIVAYGYTLAFLLGISIILAAAKAVGVI